MDAISAIDTFPDRDVVMFMADDHASDWVPAALACVRPGCKVYLVEDHPRRRSLLPGFSVAGYFRYSDGHGRNITRSNHDRPGMILRRDGAGPGQA
jgi:hypothetical protein